jgi:hypothetical protein
LLASTGAAFAITTEPYWQSPSSKDKEAYVPLPMPAGVEVVDTENEGPVFANADGKTLYTWPLSGLRNGQAGDRRNSGHATCDGTIYKETTGYPSLKIARAAKRCGHRFWRRPMPSPWVNGPP